MKRTNLFSKVLIVLFVVFNLTTIKTEAQDIVPQAINFQAIARGGDGEVMSNTDIQIRLTVLDGSSTGTEVYQELRALTTNEYGSFSFQIGIEADYTPIGTFADIDWATGNKFLRIDYDPSNQFNWDLTLGTIEFASVPFALSAGSVSYIDLTGVQEGDVLIYNATTGKFAHGKIATTNVEWDAVQNKPELFSGDYDDLTNTPNTTEWDKNASDDFSGKYEDLENKPTLFDKDYNSLTNKPSIKDSVMVNKFSGKYEDLENSPVLFDKDYNSLTNKPSIKDSVMANKFSGKYEDLENKPTLWDSTYSSIKNTPDLTVYATKDMNDNKITNLANPTDDKDAVNKKYVDLLEEKIESLELFLTEGKVKDIDGNIYPTVKIGNQVWMRENLKTTRYADGTVIPHVTGNSNWANLGSNDKAYCSYDDDESNDANGYGKFYTWAAASNGVSSNTNPSGVQGACPTGWHLPSHSELIELERAVCVENGHTDCETRFPDDETTTGWRGSDEGTSLKTVADDKFSGLLTGYHHANGALIPRGDYTYFWSSSSISNSDAWRRTLRSSETGILHNTFPKAHGFTVRCVKD